MRITSIEVTQKHNLGNYESFDFHAGAVIDEDENANEATSKLINFVDWHTLKSTRDAKARIFRLALADENTVPEKRTEAEKWLAVYEARRTEVEAM